MKFVIRGCFALAMVAPAAFAEGFYGAAGVSLQGQSLRLNSNTTADEAEEFGQSVSAFAGYAFASGLFVEGDLRYTSLSDENGYDGLQYGASAFLRGGYEQGALRTEVLFGMADVTTGNGTAGLLVAGLGGSYSLSDQVTLRGLVSHLAQPSGDEGENVPRNATGISLGATYAMNDRLSLWGDATYLDGTMDSDNESIFISEIALGVDYAVPSVPGLTAFGAISYFDAFQTGEDDGAYVTQVEIGVSYKFGGQDTPDRGKRAPLPNVEHWMATASGVME